MPEPLLPADEMAQSNVVSSRVLDGSDNVYKANVDKIDNHIPEKYTESDLLEMISATGA